MSLEGTLWIPQSIIAWIKDEASLWSPLETGGVILGYWDRNCREVVITHCIGPGPNAIHEQRRFEPDYCYQESEIARIYEESERKIQYLGDWHSHPMGTLSLSEKDIATCKRIGTFREARASDPIMIVVAGEKEQNFGAWCCSVRTFWFVWHRAVVRPLHIQEFS